MFRIQSILLVLISAFILFASSCKNQEASKNTLDKTTAEAISSEAAPLSDDEIKSYMESGKTIASSTFKAMSGKLKKALTEGGVEAAAEYCNVVALPLTDSLSKEYHASIKRTSLLLRNAKNEANDREEAILNAFQDKFEKNEEIKGFVEATDDKVHFYAPIMTKQLCLTCHGTVGQELSNENYAFLKSLYPDDQAVSYKENDLRGIWSIEMDRK